MNLSRKNFSKGLAYFYSCGGPNPDRETLEVWYDLVKHITPLDFEAAIKSVCREVTDLGRANVPGEICGRAEENRIERERKANYNRKQLEEAPDPKSLEIGKAVCGHIREKGFKGLDGLIKKITAPVKLRVV